PAGRSGSLGKMKGRYDKVLVDFWTGRNNPPDTLNDGIRLLALVLPFFGKSEAEAVALIEDYIDALPDWTFRGQGIITSHFSEYNQLQSFLSAGDRKMHLPAVHQCACPDCLQPGGHPNKELHRQLNLVLSRLDERQRRWLVALEAQRLGHGGARLVSVITGC